MSNYFTVNFYKRLITVFVIALILALSVTVVVLGIRVNNELASSTEIMGEAVFGCNESNSFEYQSKYPSMFVNPPEELAKEEQKTVYLTFDDGPSKTTEAILDILSEYDIKGTFFIVHNNEANWKSLVQREINEGHTVGIHAYYHEYEYIYRSVDTYLKDFSRLWSLLDEELGYKATIFRFPGGSVNTYNLGSYSMIIPEMYRRGFRFYDWNVSAEDATSYSITGKEMAHKMIRDIKKKNGRSIVLLHDSQGKEETVYALRQVIKTLKKDGYTFKSLDNNVRPMTFI